MFQAVKKNGRIYGFISFENKKELKQKIKKFNVKLYGLPFISKMCED
jgi:hypothetical protein